MIEESAARTGHITNLPLTIDKAELAVFPADDLGLEADGGI